MIYYIVSVVLIGKCHGGIEEYKALNETIDDEVLSREKRFLVFPPTTGLSVLKYVAGYLGPIVSCFKIFLEI